MASPRGEVGIARASPNKHKEKKKALLAALESSLGVVTTACRIAGVCRWTFYNYYKTDAQFRLEVDDITNIALDFAESQLHQRIAEGDVASTIFYLKTKGRHRGYIERNQTEISGPDGGPIMIAVVEAARAFMRDYPEAEPAEVARVFAEGRQISYERVLEGIKANR